MSATATGIGQLFSASYLYLGYVIAALLAVAAILDGYIRIRRRSLKKELARIERIEEEEAAPHAFRTRCSYDKD
jgi:hypothetical protein